MLEPTSLLSVAKALKKPLDDIYELGKSQFKNKLKIWKVDKNINDLYKRISSIQKVKTIWQVDKEVNLKKFYYPSKLLIEQKPTLISQIKNIPNNSNIVIQGTVGQGKSIFLRYLCSQELRSGLTIPIFFELRKIENNKTLKQNLSSVLDSWGFCVDDDLFNFLAESGKLVFLLDGFDEIELSSVARIINEIEKFSEKYEKLKIIITSRPDSGIEKSSYFRVYNLAPLEIADYPGILKKLVGNPEQEESILNALKASSVKINDILKTPLMITLLVIVYKSEQKIPVQFSEFYENIFQTLLLRHDKSKPGYVREKKCSVNERKLQELFEGFCFLSSKNELVTMSYEQIHDMVNKAIDVTGIECDASDFIYDISKIACLVIEEGFDYHFIHKSVREYHSANFIKRRPDDFAIKYYKSMLNDNWRMWEQELKFLSQVDEYRYTRYLLIPMMKKLAEKYSINLAQYQPLKKEDSIIKELKNNIVTFEVKTLRKTSYKITATKLEFADLLSVNITGLAFIFFESKVNKQDIKDKFIDLNIKTRYSDDEDKLTFKASDFFTFFKLEKEVLNIINMKYKEFITLYEDKCNYLISEEKKEQLLEF